MQKPSSMGRVGRKRNDQRWQDPSGVIWASKFEWEVYDTLNSSGLLIRRCDASDTIDYTEPKPNVSCVECGSSRCAQNRTYTPDLYIVPSNAGSNSGGYYLEVKGYFRNEKRKLFRCLRASRPDVDLRIVFSSDHWVTRGKTRLSDYFNNYVKNTPYHIWDGDLPEDWK